MAWFKRNPLLGSILAVLALVLVAEGWFWWDGAARSKKALAALNQKTQEREWLGGKSPALSEENAQAIADDLAATQKHLSELQRALAGRDARALAAPVPAKSIDLYFDIASFVEKTRALATRAQVAIKPDERFGFASHANEGPELDLVPAVFRQRLVAQYLVEALIEARPRALLAMQRERPITLAARGARNQPVDPYAQPAPPTGSTATPGGQPADYFELDRTLSVRVPGKVESDAFRLEFTGQTPSLRAFLNTLAEFRLPLLVRSVEVEPLRNELPVASAAGDAPVDPAAPVPLVTQNYSKFTVIVELAVLLTSPEPPSP